MDCTDINIGTGTKVIFGASLFLVLFYHLLEMNDDGIHNLLYEV